eukprot:Blabericola_migrator_1__5407@NODE_276_length_10491_cov_79_093918_g229_i0_p7_GENE_NODE_276_length_10491_cov_79_093918_g229_i0NODE_276_length_10491_cov_79_093918_g229_i0_p7_ORF_typecomplete_len116_score11_64_NODE_276_length_10491_cov_79_093918_g229_i060216368
MGVAKVKLVVGCVSQLAQAVPHAARLPQFRGRARDPTKAARDDISSADPQCAQEVAGRTLWPVLGDHSRGIKVDGVLNVVSAKISGVLYRRSSKVSVSVTSEILVEQNTEKIFWE